MASAFAPLFGQDKKSRRPASRMFKVTAFEINQNHHAKRPGNHADDGFALSVILITDIDRVP
jgi:hypothetical protein